MAYSKAKLKSNGDKASPCFKPFLIGNVSDKWLFNVILFFLYLNDYTIKYVFLTRGGTIFTCLCVYSACMCRRDGQNRSLPRYAMMGLYFHTHCVIWTNTAIATSCWLEWITDLRNWDLGSVSYLTDLFNCNCYISVHMHIDAVTWLLNNELRHADQ
jgi:hypothetical protein